MFRSCSECFFTNHNTETKLRIICRSIYLLNRNTQRFSGIIAIKYLSFGHMFKSSERQSLMQLAPSMGNKHLFDRSIHSSTPALSNLRGKNQRKEEMKNYIFISVLGGICLSMFIFSTTMRTHDDYVIVNPNGKNK